MVSYRKALYDRLKPAGYVINEKEIVDRKPHTMIHLSTLGREAFRQYKQNLQAVLNELD